MPEHEGRALHLATTLADALQGTRLEDTLASLTRAAVETLPGVDHASITMRHEDGSIESYASTADFLNALDQSQYDEQEGPCYDGVTNNAFTVCGDLLNDPRYPRYGRRAAEAGIRSQAGVRLFESGKATGALNLYSRSVGALADISFLAGLFSQHARTAIAYAREIEGLNQAMLSRQLIGQAVGVLMERYRLSSDRAFAFLARVSQDRNVKLRVVAEEVLAAPATG
jgi:GAF domain-containing protein